jgi:hypothetical protein
MLIRFALVVILIFVSCKTPDVAPAPSDFKSVADIPSVRLLSEHRSGLKEVSGLVG